MHLRTFPLDNVDSLQPGRPLVKWLAVWSCAAALFGLLGGLAAPSAAHAEIDSTKIPRANTLPDSNCPNIDGEWYATGQVPGGYYKSFANGLCYPIPACPGGTAWSSSSQTCESICPAGTTWDGSSCYAPPPPPLPPPPDPPAPPGCSAPSLSFSVGPASQTVGQNFTVNWSASSSTAVSVTGWCSGAFDYSGPLSPASGSATFPANQGATSCGAQATNDCGATTSSSTYTVYACPSGQTWNGTQCVAPPPPCTAPPTLSFSVTPATQVVGQNFTANWAAAGDGAVTVSASCSGAYSFSGPLSPNSGAATFPANEGVTSCAAVASNQCGSVSSSTSNVTACPLGFTWDAGQSKCGWPLSTTIAPSVSFTLSPSTAVVGSSFTASWSTTGSPIPSVTLVCSGANGAGTYSLATSGSRSIPANTAGITNCTMYAQNSAGTATAPATASAICAAGTTWDPATSTCKAPVAASSTLYACPPAVSLWANVGGPSIPLADPAPPVLTPDGHQWCYYYGMNAGDAWAGAFDRVVGKAVSYWPVYAESPAGTENDYPQFAMVYQGSNPVYGPTNSSTYGGSKCATAGAYYQAFYPSDCGGSWMEGSAPAGGWCALNLNPSNAIRQATGYASVELPSLPSAVQNVPTGNGYMAVNLLPSSGLGCAPGKPSVRHVAPVDNNGTGS